MKIPYFISTGEPSGDLLGADLVIALQKLLPNGEAHGIVGPKLREAGVVEAAGIEDLSVMGFVDVVRHFIPIKLLEDRLVIYLERLKPHFIVMVDYPGFHMHLAERIRSMGIPIFQYVAPQLWAWGEKRVEKLKKVTDKVLGIMPFEEAFFRNHGLDFTYVGTPQVDRAAKTLSEGTRSFTFSNHQKVIGLFPGSRRGEVSRILPSMMEIANRILESHKDIHIAISIAPSIDIDFFSQFLSGEDILSRTSVEMLSQPTGEAELKERITLVKGRSLQLMKRVDAALVTSGTATLECALTETPMAVVYVAGAITFAIASRLVKLKYISLVNLVAGEGIVNEYVQNFLPKDIANHLIEISTNRQLAEEKRDKLIKLHQKLKGEPGLNTAIAILEHLKRPQTKVQNVLD